MEVQIMTIDEMIASIKSELGGDIVSLAIADTTIKLKIGESLRKVGAHSPLTKVESFTVTGEKVLLPEGSIAVVDIMSSKDPNNISRGRDDEIDIFSPTTYMMNGDVDPTSYLIRRNEIDSVMNFVERTDWYYVKESRTIYLNYYNRPTATVKYLKKYTDVSEIVEDDVLDIVQNYALALCKIIEGGIRRKLSQSPGAMVMDGTELVQEGKEEKTALEEQIKKQFTNLRFGIRA
jgi:hypothetical protein